MGDFIKNVYRYFFNPVEIGGIYIFTGNDRNPFENEPHQVEVVDVKDGFVKYDRGSGPLRFDSMNKLSFNGCFKLKE